LRMPRLDGSIMNDIGKTKDQLIQELEELRRRIAELEKSEIECKQADGNFQYVSPSSERLTGYHCLEFINNPDLFLDIIHPDDKKLVKSHLKIIREETDFLSWARPGGKEKTIRVLSNTRIRNHGEKRI
jgi:PAS domain S-box-containing protein